jgi:hypothetical protein
MARANEFATGLISIEGEGKFKPFVHAASILALLISLYCLTYRGALQVDDEQILMARAQSLANRGELSYPQLYGNGRVTNLSTVNVDSAGPDVAIEPGQAWFGSLFYRIAPVVGGGGAQTALTLNVFATALTGLLVYLTERALGFHAPTAIVSALLFGTATMAWPYAGTFFRDPLAMVMTTMAMLGLAVFLRGGTRQWLAGSLLMGGSLIGGALCKGTSLVVLPALGVGFCVQVLARGKRLPHWARLAGVGFLALPIAFASLVPSVGPLARISVQYWIALALQGIGQPPPGFIPALLGPLLSPAKSVLLFSPILVLAPFALGLWAQPRRAFASAAASAVLFLCLAQAMRMGDMWAGSLIWGLRYMLPAIPLLVILSAPLIETWLRVTSIRIRLTGGLLALGSVAIQAAGAIVPWSTPFVVWAEQGLNPYALQAVWDIQYLSIPIHLTRLGMDASRSIGWVRLEAAPMAWLIPISCVIILLVSLFCLLGRIPTGGALTIALVAVVFPLFPMAQVLRADPAWGGDRSELAAIARSVAAVAGPDDLILVDSYGSPLWRFMLNRWQSPLTWYSLPESGSLPSATVSVPPHVQQLVDEARSGRRTIWLMCSSIDDSNGCGKIGATLDIMLGPGVTQTFVGSGTATLRVYGPTRPPLIHSTIILKRWIEATSP